MLEILLAISVVLDPGGSFRVVGWADATATVPQYSQIFTVQVDADDVPPLVGAYSIQQGELVFTPRFPLQPGLSYRATLKIPREQPIVQRFVIPKAVGKPGTLVEHIYPSAATLPENQLKFYIHFSAPMSRGEAYRRIHLIDETGSPVALPFLELEQELWDQDGRRFTIYFDPGRIKSGLLPRTQSGPPIHEGRKYDLVIDPEWHDAKGEPLRNGFQKSFRVGPAERHGIELAAWRVGAPGVGTLDPVTVEFPAPLDHALLEHEIEVTDRAGNRISGRITIDSDETRWSLTPETSWNRGMYTLRVGRLLADLAGNMVGRPFEVDSYGNEKHPNQPGDSLFFEVKK